MLVAMSSKHIVDANQAMILIFPSNNKAWDFKVCRKGTSRDIWNKNEVEILSLSQSWEDEATKVGGCRGTIKNEKFKEEWAQEEFIDSKWGWFGRLAKEKWTKSRFQRT